MDEYTNGSERFWAGMSYVCSLFAPLFVPVLIFVFGRPSSRFVAFHALQSLFIERSPMHDGAVIIRLDRVIAARDPARLLVFCDEAAEVTDPIAALSAARAGRTLPPHACPRALSGCGANDAATVCIAQSGCAPSAVTAHAVAQPAF